MDIYNNTRTIFLRSCSDAEQRHGIRNCANCSFSLGDYRRDTRGGITTSFSRKEKKNGKDESLVDLIRSLPLDAFLYFLVDLSFILIHISFFSSCSKKKKKRFYSSVIVLFPLLSSSFFVAR